MPTLTTNYDFQLPVVGADDDVWGDFLNANWSALDTQLFSGSIGADTTGNAATATSAAALATARTLTVGDTGKTFDGSADVSWTLGEIGVTLASQAEAEAGTDNTKFMTPLRTAEAIAGLVPAGTPTATVIYVAQNTAPDGFLKANGAAISRTVYADLFTAIGTTFGSGDGSTTFNLPDLRGEFLRGWDDGRGIDSGRGFGSAQADEFKSHSHQFSRPQGDANFGNGGVFGTWWGSSFNVTVDVTSSGGTETRPRNIALLACIKY